MTSLFVKVQLFLMNLRDEERGQDLIEYALFGGLIAAAIIAFSVAAYQGLLTGMLNGMKNCVDFDGGTICNPF